MKKIMLGETVLTFTESPNWIKVNPKTGVFIEATIIDATGVAVNGTAYHLEGQGATYGGGDVTVVEVDSAEELIKMYANIRETQDNADVIAELDEAVIDYELRIATLEATIDELSTSDESNIESADTTVE